MSDKQHKRHSVQIFQKLPQFIAIQSPGNCALVLSRSCLSTIKKSLSVTFSI